METKKYLIKKRLIIFLLLILFVINQKNYAQLIQPEDLVYKGAFLTPEWVSDTEFWEYGGMAMTYYPLGDPDGPNDGYPGSIIGSGYDALQYFSEISIPEPVISTTKNINELNTAKTLQPFSDVTGGLFAPLLAEMPRVGVAYLPKQAGQTSDKLYYCWGAHFQEAGESSDMPSYSWSNLDLSNPQTVGVWWIDCSSNYSGNDYMFTIPKKWADANTPGMRLVSGRYRDGGWSGYGPSLYAFGPWLNGNPPLNGDTLTTIRLLQYTDNYNGEPETVYQLNNYAHSDEWSGGEWLTAGNNSAVIFVGTKGIGDTWYGNEDGPCLTCDNRGWWSTEFQGQILFYDPRDFAKVAKGTMQPYEPQPYAVMNIDSVLFYIRSNQQWFHVGAASYDSQNHFLYIFESGRFEDDRTLVHVWEVKESPTSVGSKRNLPTEFKLYQNYPNPFNPTTIIKYSIPVNFSHCDPDVFYREKQSQQITSVNSFFRNNFNVTLKVYDMLGKKVATLVNKNQSPGIYEVTFDASNLPSGVYIYKIRVGSFKKSKKLLLMK